MPLITGSRLGPYEVVGLLGAGGMGEVYRARDLRLGRTVALKVLPSAFTQDAERLRRFEQEARTASTLNHPGIVSVHDVGVQDGLSFLVLELLEGQTLRELLARGPLPVRKASDYAAQVARGLAAAHGKGIVNRDLKPENLFVTADGRAKILDFGLAKSSPAPLSAHQATGSLLPDGAQTEPGVVLGTLGYLAPEQLRGQPADPRSDLFALGAVLYEMLTGRRAFAGESSADVMSAILSRDPPGLSASVPGIPQALERIVVRCLEKRAEERFQSAGDLAFALEALSESSGRQAAATGGAQVPPERWPAWLLPGLLAGVAAAALLVLAVTWTRRPEPPAGRPVRFEVKLPDGTDPMWFPTAGSMSLSPDGRQLALVALTTGQPMLWLRALDRLEATPVEGSEGAASPFWSPDGRSIAFFAGGQLKKMSAAGGPAEAICRAEFGNAGSWGPDGTILFTEWGGQREGLYRVPERGGAPTRLDLRTSQGLEQGLSWPVFLADGQHFVYLSGAFGRRPPAQLAVARLGSLEARHVGPIDSRPLPVSGGRLLFVRDGTLLVQVFDPSAGRLQGEPTPVAAPIWYMRPSGSAEFTVSADGSALAFRGPRSASRLVWLDRSGREVGAVGAPGNLDHPALSPDGLRVAFELEDDRAAVKDIWTHDLARDVRSPLTLDPLGAIFPVWSPNGERLLYASASQGGPVQMRLRATDGSGREEGVIQTSATQLPQDWSPDGRTVLFVDWAPSRRPQRQLWLVSLEGQRPVTPLEPAPVNRYDGRFSPDGTRVAYVSEEAGQPEVFVTPLGGPGRRQQVSTAGGRAPRWRRDGRELFYLSPDGRLMAAGLGAGAQAEAAAPRELFKVDVRGEATFDVDSRGERFLFCLGRGEPPSILVAVGWSVARRD